MQQSDYDAYLEYSLGAVKLADESHDCQLQSEYYYRLAIGYDYLKNNDSAFEWLYKALAISNKCDRVDTTHMHIARYLGAILYLGNNKLIRAFIIFKLHRNLCCSKVILRKRLLLIVCLRGV